MTKTLLQAVDIYERPNDYLLLAEMPGVSKETLEIEFEKDLLKIKGTPDWQRGKWDLSYQEYPDDYVFERNIAVGHGIDREKVSAKIENGILALILPKSEAVKPKKISIS
jgi:HSP20 family protein